MKKQSLKLESLNSGKFTPLSPNAMQSVRGGNDEHPTQGATATVAGQQVPFDHDTECWVNGKAVQEYLTADNKLLAIHVQGQGGTVIPQK